MKVSFTQTYGNDRKDLIYYQMNDEKIVKFKNMFDVNIFSFHNCYNDVVDYFWSINKLKNVKVLRFDDVDYNVCIRDLLILLEELNTEIFFFIQDDALSFSETNYKELLDTYKDDRMISLGVNMKDMVTPYRSNDGMFYEYWREDFLQSDKWVMTDAPYITSLKTVKWIYNEDYLKIGDIWTAEAWLNHRFKHKDRISRYILKEPLFRNVNTKGPLANNKPLKRIPKGLIYGEEAKKIIRERYHDNTIY
jgi:hypothetical protein